MRVLGFSEGFHDAAVAVIHDDGILFAGHSERFSKIKNDKRVCQELKQHARRYTSGLMSPQIAFYERPFIKRTRQVWAGQWKDALRPRRLSYRYDHCFAHHLSHAAAAFQCSPFTDAVALIVDAIGEWDTVSSWRCSYDEDGNAVYKKLDSIRYPTSLGLFYSAVTDRIGLKPMEEEYITMGMAAFGTSNRKLYNALKKMLTRTNLHRGMRRDLPEETKEDIAYNAQALTEVVLRGFIKKLTKDGLPIVYGGGVALNSVANGKLFKMKDHYIFPNPGDAGSALGAAALVTRKQLKLDHMFHGYQLPLLSDNQIKDVVDILETGDAVGIAAGNAEFGPRALGNRSLLCDPRTSENKDKVNEIKKRQLYRPFAPSILKEHVKFHYKISSKCDYSYMQYVVPTKTRDFIATQHVDKSARVHTVSDNLNDVSSLRKILECWYDRTGCPTLLNTSLNIRGKPMVNDKKDAAAFEKEYGVKVFCNG